MDKYDDFIGGLKFIYNIKDKFLIGDLLGKGTFGEVRKCLEIHKKHTHSTEYALKII